MLHTNQAPNILNIYIFIVKYTTGVTLVCKWLI